MDSKNCKMNSNYFSYYWYFYLQICPLLRVG